MAALEAYRDKRRFDKTPEPAGEAQGGAGGLVAGTAGAADDVAAGSAQEAAAPARLSFVIQKHAARRLHYDFRLELDGVLLSWAVPKGPSLDPKERHLAARVEDHPLEYGGFEGIIPKGEYGAGTVQLWDRGEWEPVGDPHEGLRRGDLKFTLHGEKLKGSWVLVRMKPRPGEEGKENWLLIKHRDDEAADGDGMAILKEEDRSVASGRTLEEITADGEAGDEPPLDPSTLSGARAVDMVPRFVSPEVANSVEQAPEGDSWLHEVKFDGYRVLSRIERGRVDMYSRNDKDWTAHYGLLVEELARLPAENAMLDGEVVAQMPDGRTDFQALQSLLGVDRFGRSVTRGASGGSGDDGDRGEGGGDGEAYEANEAGKPGESAPRSAEEGAGRLVYYLFDILYLNGHELFDVALEERKELLRRLLAGLPQGGRILYSAHIDGRGPEFLEQACSHGLEGVISKKVGSPYRPGARGGEWLKSKCRLEQEFVVGGWTDPAGSRTGFGALLLGANVGGELSYVGKVGTGFSEDLLKGLGERLRGMETDSSPFTARNDRTPKGSHWVQPLLVAQVAFAEWTREGGLRHASFKGLRDDKAPADVVVERPALDSTLDAAPDSAAHAAAGTASDPAPDSAAPGAAAVVYGITLTHPDKVLWQTEGLTKRHLVEHYDRVAHLMLPYVVGRPVAMVRCPEGVDASALVSKGKARTRVAPCFFHKHPGQDFPGPFERMTIEESAGPATYLAITEAGSLTALAQMGVLEIHVWGSTWPDIEHPDLLVFDLDPDPDPAVTWKALADGARLMREVLRALGLESFVKTTGGKGLHVEVPLTPSEDWETVRTFCRAVADAFVAHAPERYTANMSKAKRGGKIYVDYVRNNRGATAVAPYSTRAREHATVAVPLRWSELGGSIRPDSYTVKNIGDRLQRLKGDPWEGWSETQRAQTLTEAIRRIAGSS